MPKAHSCMRVLYLGTGADARWASMVLSAMDLLSLSSLFFSACISVRTLQDPYVLFWFTLGNLGARVSHH